MKKYMLLVILVVIGKIAEGKITRLYDYPPPLTYLKEWGLAEIPIIETDAPIDKGNSGGGLFDVDGNLIGICSSM